MTKPTTITLAAVNTVDQDPPSIPEGASRWEVQELRRCWANALKALHDTARQAADMHDRYLRAADPARPHTAGGGLTYNAMQADAALVEYHAVHNAVIHRLALELRKAEAVQA